MAIYRTCCEGCSIKAPLSDTAHTLISQHGWRTDLGRNGDVNVLRRWCPSCWAAHRERQLADGLDQRGRKSA
jgi:hypothetical protein